MKKEIKNKKNIIGIIPARFGSTRLPGKPLIKIVGKTIIQRVYEQAMKSKYISKVIVATDDKRIFNEVKSFGGICVMTSKKHKSGTDRIAEVAKNERCSIVVNIQGDEPFIDPVHIDKAIEPLIKDKNLNVSTLAVKFSKLNDLIDTNNVKVVFDKYNNALYFSRLAIPFDEYIVNNLKGLPNRKAFYKHIGLYVYRKNFLLKLSKMKVSYLEKSEKLEQLRILENGEKIKVVLTKKDSFSIDTKEDLMKINQ
jgi:3-deoxy-manno-octulosonate cytidylyltransferase (CMP-KDO synthetase)